MSTITTAPASIIWRGFSSAGATTWADETGIFEGEIPVEMIRDNLLGWDAVEGSVQVNVIDESGVTSYDDPSRKGIVNPTNGKVMGVPSTSYAIHQYRPWLLDTTKAITGNGLGYAGAGLFKHGAVAFVQAEMPETQQVHGIEYRTFINAATSHDGSMASTFNLGNTLIICSNMMGSAFGGGLKVRHTANSGIRITTIGDAMGLVAGEAKAFGEEIDRLANITVTDAQWQQFVEAHTGLDRSHLSTRSQSIADRKARDLNGLWNGDDMVAPFKNTAFGVVQAVSTARHHLDTVRGATRGERNTYSAITGSNAAADAKALDLLERVLAS
jgi:phage/plasmid-like protein (TIGR03299 family)